LLFFLFGCCLPTISSAQFELPSGDISSLIFGPLPVSARCLGMGGACTAIADDVDMLVANPAGATAIDKLTVNLQLRYTNLNSVYMDQDVFESEVLGPRPGRLYKMEQDQPVNVAFVGISKPIGQWTVSAFYQQRLDFQGGLDIEEVWDLEGDHLFTNRNGMSISLEGLGASVAYQFSDSWSIGVTAVKSELDLGVEDSWQINSLSGAPVLQSEFDMILLGTRIDDKATDTLLQFGLLYQPEGRFSAGINYSQGGEYDLSSLAIKQLGQNGEILDMSAPASTTISLADTLSVGFGWRHSPLLLFSLDIAHLGHSVLPPVRNHSLGLNLSLQELVEPIDDTISIKLGFEKQFSPREVSGNRYAIRVGVFSEEDHNGLSIVEGYDTHFTLGFGAALGRNNRFNLDIGIEGGDEEITFITSLKYALH
jgi:long-subunit fatty acid transport protein